MGWWLTWGTANKLDSLHRSHFPADFCAPAAHRSHARFCTAPFPLLCFAAMVASSRLLHLAAAAATTAVATCFACPGRISGAGSCTPGSTSAADGAVTPPRTASARRLAASCGGVDGGREPSRSSTAVCAISSAQGESAVLRTRGGGSAASGVNDPGLSETDDEVWQIINAERRRQVRGCLGVAHRASQTRFAGGVLSASLWSPATGAYKMEPVQQKVHIPRLRGWRHHEQILRI